MAEAITVTLPLSQYNEMLKKIDKLQSQKVDNFVQTAWHPDYDLFSQSEIKRSSVRLLQKQKLEDYLGKKVYLPGEEIKWDEIQSADNRNGLW